MSLVVGFIISTICCCLASLTMPITLGHNNNRFDIISTKVEIICTIMISIFNVHYYNHCHLYHDNAYRDERWDGQNLDH